MKVVGSSWVFQIELGFFLQTRWAQRMDFKDTNFARAAMPAAG
jgi:hypothetical protein